MTLPGSFASIVPPGDDAVPKQFADLTRQIRELGPSIAESFAPVILALQAQQADLAAQQADLEAQQVSLTATVANLASRVSVSTSIPNLNTGLLPNDATFHDYGSAFPITIDVPTGRLIVTVGCGQATVAPGGSGAAVAEATFSISGGVAAMGDYDGRFYVSDPTVSGGSSIAVSRSFVVTPGTYTITGQLRAWASGTAAASIQFSQPYLTVQVTG